MDGATAYTDAYLRPDGWDDRVPDDEHRLEYRLSVKLPDNLRYLTALEFVLKPCHIRCNIYPVDNKWPRPDYVTSLQGVNTPAARRQHLQKRLWTVCYTIMPKPGVDPASLPPQREWSWPFDPDDNIIQVQGSNLPSWTVVQGEPGADQAYPVRRVLSNCWSFGHLEPAAPCEPKDWLSYRRQYSVNSVHEKLVLSLLPRLHRFTYTVARIHESLRLPAAASSGCYGQFVIHILADGSTGPIWFKELSQHDVHDELLKSSLPWRDPGSPQWQEKEQPQMLMRFEIRRLDAGVVAVDLPAGMTLVVDLSSRERINERMMRIRAYLNRFRLAINGYANRHPHAIDPGTGQVGETSELRASIPTAPSPYPFECAVSIHPPVLASSVG